MGDHTILSLQAGETVTSGYGRSNQETKDFMVAVPKTQRVTKETTAVQKVKEMMTRIGQRSLSPILTSTGRPLGESNGTLQGEPH